MFIQMAWGAAGKTSLASVSKLMNKSIRAMFFKSRRDDIKPLYDDNRFLSLSNIIKLNWGCMIKKSLLGHFSDEFVLNSFNKQTHQFMTRTKNKNLILPSFSLKYSRNSIFFSGINFWNQNKISDDFSLNAFKDNLKQQLLNDQFENQSLY